MAWHRQTSALIALLILFGFGATASAGPILYAVQSNGDDHLYSIDAATGVATDLGLVDFGDAEGLAFVGSTLYAIGGTVDEFWDITTPPGVLIGSAGARTGIDAGLDYDPNTGTMYHYNSFGGGGDLYTINLGTGAATPVGSNDIFIDGLAIDSSGNLFGIDGVFTSSLYSINLSTGAATLIGPLGIADGFVRGLAFADGTLYGLSTSGQIYTLNTGTGAATLMASTTCGGSDCNGWEGLAAQAAVPEPTTLILIGIGLAGLGLARRRPKA